MESSSPSSSREEEGGGAVPKVSRVCLCVDGHLLEVDAEYVALAGVSTWDQVWLSV